MVVLNVKHGWNPYLAIAAAVAVGAAIGIAQGFLFSRFVVPSFVVTLAGLLTWQGALLQVLGKTGSLNVTDPKITGLANIFYGKTTGWIIAIVVHRRLRAGARRSVTDDRVAAGLGDNNPLPQIARFVLVAVVIDRRGRDPQLRPRRAAGGADPARLRDRDGVRGAEDRPSAVTSSPSAATTRRRDGPASASTAVRVAVFAIAGAMAAVGGIMAASRLFAVNQNSGGNELLLLAIAGPVIAGTSLFGGRGSVWTALLGALVIGSISNGMDLLGLASPIKYMVTGGVLLLAVLVDAVAKQQRQTRGRA